MIASSGLAIFLMVSAGMAAADGADHWPAYGGDPGGSQRSPLTAVHRGNVDRLEQVWVHHSGDIIRAPGLAGTSWEVTPIHANGTLYYCTPLNKVFALDPATGAERWRFDPHAGPFSEPPVPIACRGVAYWAGEPATGPCQRRIFKGDYAGRLWALDADTGQPCPDFGAAAGHPGYVAAADFDNHGDGWWSVTSPPAIWDDLVIVGAALDDMVADAKDGIVRAFDVRTGELRWRFSPVPDALRDIAGGGNVWSTISVDAQVGVVFLPTTSLSTDYFGGFRGAGSDLTDAVVALDARTGELRWHRQLVHHDLFDYDLPGHPLLVTIRKDGVPRKVAIQQTKLGDVFVFDRATGEPVFPIESQPAPQTDVPGEHSAPAQPRSLGVAPFARQFIDGETLFGLTPLDRSWCRREFEASRYDGLFTPPSERGSIVFPSIRGGGNWGGAAFDPERNLLVVRADNLATRVQLFRPDDPANQEISRDYADRVLPLRGTPWWVRLRPFLSPLGLPCTAPPWGTLSAIDMDTGERRWQVPLGQARRFGLTLPATLGWGSPNVGGPLVTAGGLVFIGAGLDHHLRAFDVETGAELWRGDLPAPAMAVPMTYGAGGRQFVVVSAGGNSLAGTRLDDALVAFALPGD